MDRCFRAALAAVDGERVVAAALARDDVAATSGGGRVFGLAVGKAAAGMARGAVAVLGARLSGGLLITRDGHADGAPSGWTVHPAGHPVPDARSAAAGRAALRAVAALEPADTLLVLLSGGASALTSCPAEGLTPDDLAATTDVLLARAVDIEAINCVRKHLSAVAGGRLARATRAGTTRLLALSDVPGDRLDVIGSGPCVADPTRFADAHRVLAEAGCLGDVPHAVRRHLEAGARGERPESPKAGDPALDRVRASVVGRNADARRAALAAGRDLGLEAVDLGECLGGEARRTGPRLVHLAAATRSAGPRLLVAGGETVVRLRGGGRGGRNQELALAAALALAPSRAGGPAIGVLAAGTDGTDGPTDAAGGFVDATSVARAVAGGLDPRALLDDNDSHRFLEAVGGLVVTGPTGTNVMDLALLHVGPDGSPSSP